MKRCRGDRADHGRNPVPHAAVTPAGGTVVDSSVLLDVFTEDPTWLQWSQAQLTAAAQGGALVLNAVVLAEIAPRFSRIEALRAARPSMAMIEAIPLAASRSQRRELVKEAAGRRDPEWHVFDQQALVRRVNVRVR
jgi:hypothetical protein